MTRTLPILLQKSLVTANHLVIQRIGMIGLVRGLPFSDAPSALDNNGRYTWHLPGENKTLIHT